MLASVSYQLLDLQFQNFYDLYLATECKDRRVPVAVDPNLENETWEPNGLYLPNLNIEEKILLGVLQWYMPEDLSVLMNLWLEEHWGGEFKEIRDVLLSSKDTALGYILVSDRWNERDFYGNVLKKERVRKILRYRFRKRVTRKPTKKVWRRGYNDKGNLRLPHEVPGYDYRKFRTVQEQMAIVEEQQKKFEDLLLLILERLEQEGVA